MKIEFGKKYRLTFKGARDKYETVIPACYVISVKTEDGESQYLFRISNSLTTVDVRCNDITSAEPFEDAK